MWNGRLSLWYTNEGFDNPHDPETGSKNKTPQKSGNGEGYFIIQNLLEHKFDDGYDFVLDHVEEVDPSYKAQKYYKVA